MDAQTGDCVNNSLQELSGYDTILVGAGNIALIGGDGDDTMTGGADNDQIAGNTGDELFIFSRGSRPEILVDFTSGAGIDDVIDISAYGFSDIASVQAASVDSAVNMIIDLDELPGGDQLILNGVNVVDLEVSDFLI